MREIKIDEKQFQQLVDMAEFYLTTVELLVEDILEKGIKAIEETR